MTTTPYLPRQLNLLSARFQQAQSPICVLVYDTQGPGPIIEHLCGRAGEWEQVVNGIAWFRLSNYLPTGERLVKRLQEVVSNVDWIFLHIGCSIMPEKVFQLLEYIAEQQFEVPRFVLIGESLDVTSGDDRMKKVFSSLGTLIDLRAPGS